MGSGTVYVRGVEQETKESLTQRARKSNMSLNEYCKQLFRASCESNAMLETEQRYANLVKVVSEALAKNTSSLDEVLKKLDDLEYRINQL